MSSPTIDYDALAQQHGGAGVDYDALAAQHGGGPAPAQSWAQKAQQEFDAVTAHQPYTPVHSAGDLVRDAGTAVGNFGGGLISTLAPVFHPEATLQNSVTPQGVLSNNPVTGPMMMAKNLAEQTAQGRGAEVAGQVAPLALAPEGGEGEAPQLPWPRPGAMLRDAGTAIHEGAATLLPSLVDGSPESMLTRAIKPGKNNVSWNQDLQSALPQMKSAEQALGHPITGVDDALQAAQIAKKNIWGQYQQRLQGAGQTGATIDGNQIADAMVSSIDQRTALQNPGLVDKVKAVADTYRRPMSLSQAEDFLQSANTDLTTYYAKNKVGQQVAQNDPEIASTVAEGQALRTALYSKLDQLSGPGAAQLKQAYGALTNVQKELYGRQLVAARQNPESLSEQLSTVAGAGKIAKGVLTMNPGDVIEGAQNIGVSRALKSRNSSDSMIERAFQSAQPAQPFPAPTFAPQAAYQLPAKSGAPTIIPYNPEMTPGERVAALMQQIRSQPARSLPAQSIPLQLPASFK